MHSLAAYFGRFALPTLLLAGAAWGQAPGGISSRGTVDARRFDSIPLVQDVKSEPQSGTKIGSSSAPTVASGQTAPVGKTAKSAAHKFWDKQNILLFAGVGAARGLDYASTLNIRRRGINEALLTNAIVDDHAEFAAIEAATAAASVGLSYVFHATGHHKLERWTSYIHIGVTVAGAGGITP